MRGLLFALTVALAGGAAAAQAVDPPRSPDDPLQSADCRQALESLQVQEAAALASPWANGPSDGRGQRAPDARLQASRRNAAAACLASRDDPPPAPQHLAQPPIVVAPITVARPTAPPALRIEPMTPLPKPVDRPRFTMSCDAAGCWADDGSRLNRVGPNLWGSRGVCTVVGTLLQCP